jgi:hypothetical protein
LANRRPYLTLRERGRWDRQPDVGRSVKSRNTVSFDSSRM